MFCWCASNLREKQSFIGIFINSNQYLIYGLRNRADQSQKKTSFKSDFRSSTIVLGASDAHHQRGIDHFCLNTCCTSFFSSAGWRTPPNFRVSLLSAVIESVIENIWLVFFWYHNHSWYWIFCREKWHNVKQKCIRAHRDCGQSLIMKQNKNAKKRLIRVFIAKFKFRLLFFAMSNFSDVDLFMFSLQETFAQWI